MSIFKETFPQFIIDQLKIREDIISSGAGKTLTGSKEIFNFNENRENDFFTYTLSKQCTLRMSSGVNITDQDLLKDLINSTQESLPSTTLAERFILQGGVKTPNLQGGIGEGGAYGDPNLVSSAGEDGLGIVPMPGIIDATISTKSAYGSLREAKVKFVAHNKKQLQILEMLYMRPGYTLLLEWGWTPYYTLDVLRTSRIRNNTLPFISNFFSSDTTTEILEKDILSKKDETGGNYDALLGYCKNFSYSLRPDGGFNCETEIIAKGEVIESLKDEESRSPVSNETLKYTYSPRTLILLDKIRQYSVAAADASSVTIQNPFKAYAWSNAFETAGTEKRRVELFSNGLIADLELSSVEELSKFIVTKNEEDKGWDVGNNKSAIRSETSYIRWDALCFLINKYIVPSDSNGKPLFQLQTNRLNNVGFLETLKYVDIVPNKIKKNASNLKTEEWSKYGTVVETKSLNWNIADVSVNPMMFQFPHVLFNQPNELLGGYKNKIYDRLFKPLAKELAKTSPYYEQTNLDEHRFLISGRDITHSIGGIFIGVEYLISTFKSMYYDEIGAIKDDYSLFNFIKRIWEDINGACNNNHEFDIHVENGASGKILRVVDFIADAGEIELDKVHELKIQSLDSVVRDIVYNTSLPSSLSTTIAVAAQAPDSIDSLDRVSFAAISENIQDRFAAPAKTDNTPSEDQIKRWETSFNKNIRELEAISYIIGNYRDLDTGEIGDPVLYDKKSGILTEFVLDVDEKSNQYSDENSFEDFSKYRGAVGQVRKSIDYLYKVYWYTNKDKTKFQGQPIPDPSPRLSAVIPLKFNLKLDGISGIVIGNVFKLPKNRLPFSYREDDIYFIVMGEEQSINSKQDWTTSIKGQLILLRSEEDEKNKMDTNWENLAGTLVTKKSEQEVRLEEDDINAFKNYAKDTPWSAAFISSMVKQAGGYNFPYSANHVRYSLSVINKVAGAEAGTWEALDPLTTQLKRGDIVVKNRGSSTNEFGKIQARTDSHGDIVVGVNIGSVDLMGGNVSQTVKLVKLETETLGKEGTSLSGQFIDIDNIALSEKSLDNLNGKRTVKLNNGASFTSEIKRSKDYRKKSYFVILRCSDSAIVNPLVKECNDALKIWDKKKETDPEIAQVLYSYYVNAGLAPPPPNSLR